MHSVINHQGWNSILVHFRWKEDELWICIWVKMLISGR